MRGCRIYRMTPTTYLNLVVFDHSPSSPSYFLLEHRVLQMKPVVSGQRAAQMPGSAHRGFGHSATGWGLCAAPPTERDGPDTMCEPH